MNDLVEGDSVFVKHNEEIIESTILVVFRHYRSSIRFLDICTAGQMMPLRLTPLHSLLVLSKYDTRERYSFAKDLSIGDFVFLSDLRPLKVVNIKEVVVYNDSGYAPLTFEGNIIINDLIASCYAKYGHSTMHIITTPIRWWFFILFKYQQFPYFNYLQKLTTDIIVSFIDFDLRSIF